jgi:hypothetical protein
MKTTEHLQQKGHLIIQQLDILQTIKIIFKQNARRLARDARMTDNVDVEINARKPRNVE